VASVSSPKFSSWLLSFLITLTVSTSISAIERPDDAPQSTASAAPEADSARAQPKCPQPHTFNLPSLDLQKKALGFLTLPEMLNAKTVSKAWHQMITGVVPAFLQNHFRQAHEAYQAVLKAIGPMGRTKADSQQAFGQGFLRYLLKLEDKDSIEAMCNLGLTKGLQMRFFGYAEGRYEYTQDPEMAWAINQYLIARGHKAALLARINGLGFGEYGYPCNPAKAFKLNEALADQGDVEAGLIRVDGFGFKEYGYPLDPKKSNEFNEAFADQGHEEAVARRIFGFDSGEHGYPLDRKKAREVNDHLADLGNEAAQRRRINGYLQGVGGYPQDFAMVQKLRESLQNQRNQQSIMKWIQEYGSRGEDKCPENSPFARALGESPWTHQQMQMLCDQLIIEWHLNAIVFTLQNLPSKPPGGICEFSCKFQQEMMSLSETYEKSLRQRIQEYVSMEGDNCQEHSALSLGCPWTHQQMQILCDALISQGHPEAIARKLYDLTSESPGALYQFSPEVQKDARLLIKTFLPKEPEASVPASAAAAIGKHH
jgi:hypothetical protein